MTPRRFFQALALAPALLALECAAQNAPPQDECRQIALPRLDPSLTREEKIALLDQAMLDALNQTDRCRPGGGGGGGGGSGGDGASGDGGSGASAGESAGKSAVESQAASDVQGDMAEDAAAQDGKPAAETTAETTETADTRASEPSSPAQTAGRPDKKLPSDIPASTTANDDIIAKQFRAAAESETDPKARAQLWNEYRRYKGLPVQPAPDDS
ncbi:MAG: hypothetical protein OD918_02145 [Gammaproteobacteria bacterium]